MLIVLLSKYYVDIYGAKLNVNDRTGRQHFKYDVMYSTQNLIATKIYAVYWHRRIPE